MENDEKLDLKVLMKIYEKDKKAFNKIFKKIYYIFTSLKISRPKMQDFLLFTPLPKYFKVELSFKKHWKAFKISFYPGMKQISSTNVLFESDNYFDVLRMLMFVT